MQPHSKTEPTAGSTIQLLPAKIPRSSRFPHHGRAGTRSQPFLLQILFSFYYTTKWKYFLIVALDLKAKASEKPGYFDEIMGIIL